MRARESVCECVRVCECASVSVCECACLCACVCGGGRAHVCVCVRKPLYMRHKQRVSRYVGGRALVCCILGGVHLRWALSLFLLGGGSGWRISGPEPVTCGGDP